MMSSSHGDAPASSALTRAARVGGRVSLLDVRLARVAAELGDFGAPPPYQASLATDVSWEWDDDERTVLVYDATSHLAVRGGDGGDGGDGAAVFTADVTFLLVYRVPDDAAITDEEADGFGSVTVTFAAHPYIRELVHTLTARAGLPPLILDVLRLPLPAVGEASPEEISGSG